MRNRCLSCLSLFVLLAPWTAAAQDKAAQPKKDESSLILRLRSLDALIETSRLEALKPIFKNGPNIEEMIKEKAGPNGLEGVDYRRPIGVYGHLDIDPEKLLKALVFMVPVNDEQKFLATLDKVGFKPEKGQQGLYTIKQNQAPVDFVMRFGNRYAYLTGGDPESIAPARLADPRVMFPKGQTSLVSAAVRFEHIRQDVKAQVLAKLGELPGAFPFPGNGGKAQQELMEVVGQEALRYVREALADGKELTFELDIDKKTQDLRADLVFSVRPNSELAKTIRKFGAARSQFGGLLHKDAAVNALVNFKLPKNISEKFAAFVKETGTKALTEGPDQEKNKKLKLDKLLEALLPSVESGELDAAFSLRGPKMGRFTLVGGVKVQKADQLMRVVFEILKDLPADQKDMLKLNADRVGDVAIHRLNVQTQFDAKAKELLGENPLYFAARKNAVYLALGDDGLQAIKEALQAPTTAGPPVLVDVSIGRLAQAFAKGDEERQVAEKLARSGYDRMRVTVDGGEVLRVRLELNLTAIEALGKLGKQKLLQPGEQKEKEKDKEKENK